MFKMKGDRADIFKENPTFGILMLLLSSQRRNGNF